MMLKVRMLFVQENVQTSLKQQTRNTRPRRPNE